MIYTYSHHSPCASPQLIILYTTSVYYYKPPSLEPKLQWCCVEPRTLSRRQASMFGSTGITTPMDLRSSKITNRCSSQILPLMNLPALSQSKVLVTMHTTHGSRRKSCSTTEIWKSFPIQIETLQNPANPGHERCCSNSTRYVCSYVASRSPANFLPKCWIATYSYKPDWRENVKTSHVEINFQCTLSEPVG